jgi:propanol-preferring alcohol dehydrogenase
MGVMTNSWKALPFPTQAGQVGGHEGVGEVVKLGPGVEGKKIGDRVGIKWVAYACGSCAACYEQADGVCLVSLPNHSTRMDVILTPT